MSTGPLTLPLGRLQPPPEVWAGISSAMPSMAPRPYAAAPPSKSLPLYRYRNPRPHAQLAGRGCCVGESVADMLETTARLVDPVQPPPGLSFNADAPMLSPLWIYYIARKYSREQGINLGGDGAIVSHALLAVMKDGVIPWDAWPGTELNYRNYNDARPPASALAAKPIKVSGECQRITTADDLRYFLGVVNRPVVVGLPWRGGQSTTRAGAFNWGQGNIGGHAVNLTGYSLPDNFLWVSNSWDNAGWGVQPGEGASDANGLLPRGYGYTGWRSFAALDLTPQAFASGQTEAIVITGLEWQPPKPIDPPKPVDPPDPPTPKPPDTITGTLVIDGGGVYKFTGKRVS